MKNLIAISLTSLLLLTAAPAHAKVKIVCTIPDLCDIAANVGGSLVKTRTLAKGYQDPHFVDPKPSFALALRSADLLMLVGLELEVGWLPRLITGSRNRKIVKGANGYMDCSSLVKLREVPKTKISRSMGCWRDPGQSTLRQ